MEPPPPCSSSRRSLPTSPAAASGALEPPAAAPASTILLPHGRQTATLWVKFPEERYTAVKDVDLDLTVDEATTLLLRGRKERLSCTSLLLVACCEHKPGAVEEATASERRLEDPSVSLADAGVSGTAWLLAEVATPSASETAELAAKLELYASRQVALEDLIPLGVKLFLRTVRYSDSRRKSMESSVLKNRLAALQLESENAPPHGSLRCMLLDVLLPYAHVTGAHLLKREWADFSAELADVTDIEDVRNGLLLYKPLEWAFDTSRLAFVWEPASGRFVAHLLDRSIAHQLLVTRAKELLKERFRENGGDALALAGRSFGDVHGTALMLPPGFSPLRRCLCFHAHLAREEALRKAWISSAAEFTFVDFWSNEGDEKVLAWLRVQNQEELGFLEEGDEDE